MKRATLLEKSSARRTAGASARRQTPPVAKIKGFLVAIDFSKPCLQAVEFALPLLKKFGAELHLVHVFATDYPIANMTTIPLIVPNLEIGSRIRQQLRDVVAKYSVELRAENIHALNGRAFEEICRLAQDRGMNLIVMSTRGNTGLKHLALGSTAERIVRHSPCPVLVVRPPGRGKKGGNNGKVVKPALTFEKILVPIDFSECSLKGLSYARALAQQFGSKLVLLNSVALQYYIAADEYARYDLPLFLEKAVQIARDKMRDLVQSTNWANLKVETSIEMGHAGQQICAAAKDHDIDVIVTATHGRTGLKHVLIGSTAEYIVRHAPCSVLVVPNLDSIRSKLGE
jgi:Universal stress protein UspA and related nucleotide-binding proteins